MLVRDAAQFRSNIPICPSCQARNDPTVTHITQTDAKTRTTLAIAVSNVPGLTPEPA